MSEDLLKPGSPWWKFVHHPFYYLLATMVGLFVVHPFIATQSDAIGRFVLNLLFLTMLVSCIHVISVNPRIRVIAWSVVLPAIGIRWAGYFLASGLLTKVAHGLDTALYIYIAIVLLNHVMHSESVTPDKLMAALSVYLLIGLIFANAYFLVECLYPNAFEVPDIIQDREGYQRGDIHPMSKFIYFSFVTITTLGYGDITPALPVTQSFAALEALMGQFYLTVLIARLVGLHIVHHLRQDNAS